MFGRRHESRTVMSPAEDFTPRLLKALAEVEAAGFAALAGAARGRCLAAYTTSSEWLGEVGASLTELLRACGAAIPQPTRAELEACLNEVAKVWPKFRIR
jgi:hypothetical protein